LRGAPIETITLDVDIDATDQLASADPWPAASACIRRLSALEMLLIRKSSLVIANTVLALSGTIELIPPEAPLTLFIWGPKRVLPVRLATFSIVEEAYDVDLNPIRAQREPRTTRPQLQRPVADESWLLPVPRAPGDQGSHGPGRQSDRPG
jgi:hypothetical protein